MRETLEGVEEIFDRRGPTDSTATFDRLWGITEELMAKLQARFGLTRDPSTEDLESYKGEADYPSG
ncbi:MAG: oxidoreductase, partial [Acidimicrobiales bacterium]